jgi:hypothetical protein
LVIAGCDEILVPFTQEVASLETLFVFIEMFLGLCLLAVSRWRNNVVGMVLWLLILVVAIDIAAYQISFNPLGLIFGYAPGYYKIVPAEPSLVGEYRRVMLCLSLAALLYHRFAVNMFSNRK